MVSFFFYFRVTKKQARKFQNLKNRNLVIKIKLRRLHQTWAKFWKISYSYHVSIGSWFKFLKFKPIVATKSIKPARNIIEKFELDQKRSNLMKKVDINQLFWYELTFFIFWLTFWSFNQLFWSFNWLFWALN